MRLSEQRARREAEERREAAGKRTWKDRVVQIVFHTFFLVGFSATLIGATVALSMYSPSTPGSTFALIIGLYLVWHSFVTTVFAVVISRLRHGWIAWLPVHLILLTGSGALFGLLSWSWIGEHLLQ